jgi:hypothetical protein
MGTENRRAPRFRIDQMIEMSFGREESLRCQGVDLSEGGMACRTDASLESGTRVYLLLSLAPGGDEEPVSCEGVVTRCTATDWGFEVGISFVGLHPTIQGRLQSYLKRRPRA